MSAKPSFSHASREQDYPIASASIPLQWREEPIPIEVMRHLDTHTPQWRQKPVTIGVGANILHTHRTQTPRDSAP